MNLEAFAAPASTAALIVGGGPAGLAAAIALRQRGIECTVVEARSSGIEKACGEGLMPDSREVLARLGVELHESDGQLFHGIRFENSAAHVEARFAHAPGIGVRRPHLHRRLSARAQQAGACLLWNSRIQLPEVSSAPDSSGYRCALVNGRPMRFRWLIGADGQASSVRRWAGLDPARSRSLRYGFRVHYRIDPTSTRFDMVEVHWGRRGQLYVTPVAPDTVCAVYITRDPHCDRNNLLGEFPRIAAILQSAEAVTAQRGAVSASCRLQRVATDFVALVGDASGSADAITGEGLAITFRQSLALAASIHSGSLSPYLHAHRQIGRLPHAMGELMLTLDRWPSVQVRALRALAASPRIFQDLLSAHMGEKKLAEVLARRGPRFGWNLLTQGSGA
jgi:2-polyprenyl-6-methoxyphenol hydroxylase-like FAD-dependent oxidoreductase